MKIREVEMERAGRRQRKYEIIRGVRKEKMRIQASRMQNIGSKDKKGKI